MELVRKEVFHPLVQ